MQSVPSITIQLDDQHTLVGRSRAGDGTSFVLPEMKWMLDCGVRCVPGFVPTHVFLTHTHADHVSDLAHVALSSLATSHTPKQTIIYLPAKAVPFVDRYLKHYRAMIEFQEHDHHHHHHHDDQPLMLPYQLVGCQPGQSFIVQAKNGEEFHVTVLNCHHRIDCIGFSIHRRTWTLPLEYQRLTPTDKKDLALQLKAEGKTMKDLKVAGTQPFLCFMGDTTQNVFDEWGTIMAQHSTILIECTYLDDDSYLPKAMEYGHMHWNHLRPFVEQHPNNWFVIIHTSLMYKPLQLRRFFAPYTNVHVCISQQDVDRDWNKQKEKKQQQQQQQQDYQISESLESTSHDYGTTTITLDRDEPSAPICRCMRCRPP